MTVVRVYTVVLKNPLFKLEALYIVLVFATIKKKEEKKEKKKKEKKRYQQQPMYNSH